MVAAGLFDLILLTVLVVLKTIYVRRKYHKARLEDERRYKRRDEPELDNKQA